MNPNFKINVLYVDDEIQNLTSFKATFRRYCNVLTALNTLEAKEYLKSQEIHVLITDQCMPETIGTEFLADAVKEHPEQTRILLTGYPDFDILNEAINKGLIFRYFCKPWKEELLLNAIEDGFSLFQLKTIERDLMSQLQEINHELKKLLLAT